MEEQLSTGLMNGISEFLNYANWVFIGALIFIGWVLNLYTDNDSNKGKKKPEFIRKIPKAYRVFILGLILGSFFAFALGLNNQQELVKLFFSIFIAMAIHKLGIHKLLEKVGTIVNKVTGK